MASDGLSEPGRGQRCTTREIHSAQIVLPCADLDPTVEFFVDRLGFRLDAIFPADDPSVAVLSGHGATVRLDGSLDGAAGHLRLLFDDSGPVDVGTVLAPNGTVDRHGACRPSPSRCHPSSRSS